MPDTSADRTVAISVATYRRPHLLERLLDSLHEMGCSTAFRVIVVDNDAAGSARSTALASPLDVVYEVEPEPGIVAARNRGLSLLTAADWAVVFVDDDEHVTSGWLDALVAGQARFGASVVTGPVITDFPDDTPRWIVAGGFIQRSRHATGPYDGIPATNNTLVTVEQLAVLDGQHFDPGFSMTGGSDTELFSRLKAAGVTPVWSDEAVVHEEAPHARLTFRWITRRMIRGGNVDGRIALARSSRVQVAIGGVLRIGYGVARVIVSFATLKGFRFEDYVIVCRGMGMVGAATDRLVQEYRRPVSTSGETS